MLYSASLILVKCDNHERFIFNFVVGYLDEQKSFKFALLQI